MKFRAFSLLSTAGVVAALFLTPAQAQTTTLTVGALHVGSVNDNGYNQAMHEGLLNMQANLPGVKLIEAEQVPESADSERVMENMVAQGAKLVFPQSFGYLDPALNVARRHPDVMFEHPAGYKQSANLGTFWSDTTSFEYLMGQVAGRTTRTGKLGWIIGFPIPNILTSINAFQLGALSVNPNATTQVIVNNTWVDPAKEAEAVNALADNGVDVVTMIVDSPSSVIQTAEQRGIMSMGFHCLCARNAAGDHWLTGVGFTWGPLFTKMATDVMNGTWKSTNDVGNLASGYAALAPYGPLVSEDTKALVETSKAALISGELQVFRGPIYDNTGKVRVADGQIGNFEEMLNSTDWLVQGASGQIS
ncbi:MAG TPA: BMP family ABC transporter substrate-binding protein [Chloroflexota bacterium]|nr:BMP family ABC transporter substrate-binding protein [Chloroflexota bacterium]